MSEQVEIAERDQLWSSKSGVPWEVNQPTFLRPIVKEVTPSESDAEAHFADNR